MFDIFFISYDEPNADQNYELLTSRFPVAKRIHGVEGILNAHKEAARQSSTQMFYVVDGDCEIYPLLDFYKIDIPDHQYDHTHIWRAKNAVNGLIYGFGGIKLLPTQLVLDRDNSYTDMTTSLTSKFKIQPGIGGTTRFNTSPFNAWKAGFRECAKLASRSIERQNDEETQYRLEIWMTVGAEQEYGADCIAGAKAGYEYGVANQDNKEMIAKVNDWQWLREQYDVRL